MLFFINFLPYDRHVPYLDIAFVNIEAYDLHYFVPLWYHLSGDFKGETHLLIRQCPIRIDIIQSFMKVSFGIVCNKVLPHPNILIDIMIDKPA